MKGCGKFVAGLIVAGSLFCSSASFAQHVEKKEEKKEEKKWYDRITISGYTQFRYSRLLESNEDLKF